MSGENVDAILAAVLASRGDTHDDGTNDPRPVWHADPLLASQWPDEFAAMHALATMAQEARAKLAEVERELAHNC